MSDMLKSEEIKTTIGWRNGVFVNKNFQGEDTLKP